MRFVMKVMLLLWSVYSMQLLAKPFDIMELPNGKSITLLSSAQAHIPIEERVSITATDAPQSLSVSIKKNNGEPVSKSVKIAIFDKFQSEVKYVELQTGRVFVYSFKGLSTITITVPDSAGLKGVYLEMESNKPFTLKH